MLDWLSSKIAMIIAATILIAAVSGYFLLQQRGLERVEVQEVADLIAARINDISSINGETEILMTFDEGKSYRGTLLQRTIAGISYEIEIRRDVVRVSAGDHVVSSRLHERIHVWNPSDIDSATSEDMANADRNSSAIKFNAGNDFIIENRRMIIGEMQYPTFVYLEVTKKLQNVTDNLARIIIENATPSSKELNKNVTIDPIDLIEGEPYTIQIYPRLLVVTQKSMTTLHFINVDHLWNPWDTTVADLSAPVTQSTIASIDSQHPGPIELSSVDDTFRVSCRAVCISDGIMVEHVADDGTIYYSWEPAHIVLAFIYV
jgi:DNA repair protein RadC